MPKVCSCILLAIIGWADVALAQTPPSTPPPLTPVPEPAPAAPGSTPVSVYPVSPTPMPPPRKPGIDRRGLVVGFAAGGGWAGSSFNGANDFGGFGWEFHLGGMVHPIAALEIEFN